MQSTCDIDDLFERYNVYRYWNKIIKYIGSELYLSIKLNVLVTVFSRYVF